MEVSLQFCTFVLLTRFTVSSLLGECSLESCERGVCLHGGKSCSVQGVFKVTGSRSILPDVEAGNTTPASDDAYSGDGRRFDVWILIVAVAIVVSSISVVLLMLKNSRNRKVVW
eukprot:m.145021 g.145021  ORF g.145021 m.145021 type:complete len:114 (+) comp38408_c0_seq2:17-358(+)